MVKSLNFKFLNRKGKPTVRLGRKVTRPERERRVTEMKGRIFFLLVFCICFLGSMLVADWAKAGMNVGVSSNLGNATGAMNVKTGYHSKTNAYSLRARGFDGENMRMMNTFSKDVPTGVIDTEVGIKFSSQPNTIGSLNMEEKTGVVSSDEDECFGVAVGAGASDNSETHFDSQGTTDASGVGYAVKAAGRGQLMVGAEAMDSEYGAGGVLVGSERYRYHLRTRGDYQYMGEFIINKDE